MGSHIEEDLSLRLALDKNVGFHPKNIEAKKGWEAWHK
jgi:hypothetical protein